MLEHIAFASENPEDLIRAFEEIGFLCEGVEVVESEEVKVHFLKKENLKIEVLEPLSEKSKLVEFIKKRGNAFHHIAISVRDIEGEVDKLKKKGFKFTSEKIKIGAGNKKIIFIHPHFTSGILIELCEEKNESK